MFLLFIQVCKQCLCFCAWKRAAAAPHTQSLLCFWGSSQHMLWPRIMPKAALELAAAASSPSTEPLFSDRHCGWVREMRTELVIRLMHEWGDHTILQLYFCARWLGYDMIRTRTRTLVSMDKIKRSIRSMSICVRRVSEKTGTDGRSSPCLNA